jgi:hypothetical protein
LASLFSTPKAAGEDVRDEFLGGGLADAAGNADDADVVSGAPEGSKALEGAKAVADVEERRAGSVEGSFDDRAESPCVDSLGDVVMAVDALPADGEEEVAWPCH